MATPLHYYARLRDHIARLSSEERSSLVPFDGDLTRLEEIYSRGDEAERRMGLYLYDDTAKFDGLFSDKMCQRVSEVRTRDLIAAAYARSGTNDPLNRALSVDFETLLPDQVLTFVDRLSMAHSVEVRTPFLDYRLMEYVASLPGNFKIKGGRVKHILKEAVADLLPREILDRPKEGFVLPINDWIMGSLSGYIRAILQPSRLARHGLLCPDMVGVMVNEHFSGSAQNGPRLWNLAMFQLWWEKYFT